MATDIEIEWDWRLNLNALALLMPVLCRWPCFLTVLHTGWGPGQVASTTDHSGPAAASRSSATSTAEGAAICQPEAEARVRYRSADSGSLPLHSSRVVFALCTLPWMLLAWRLHVSWMVVYGWQFFPSVVTIHSISFERAQICIHLLVSFRVVYFQWQR